MDFDTMLHRVGDFDRYQKFIYFLICLPASFPSAWTAFNQVFVAAVPDHWCNIGVPEGSDDYESIKNRTIPLEMRDGQLRYSQCNQYNLSSQDQDGNYQIVPCQSGWAYDRTTYLTTIVTEVFLRSYKLTRDHFNFEDIF